MSNQENDSFPAIMIALTLGLFVLYIKYDEKRNYYNQLFFESVLIIGYTVIGILSIILICLLIWESEVMQFLT